MNCLKCYLPPAPDIKNKKNISGIKLRRRPKRADAGGGEEEACPIFNELSEIK